jgi:hypothetical protein
VGGASRQQQAPCKQSVGNGKLATAQLRPWCVTLAELASVLRKFCVLRHVGLQLTKQPVCKVEKGRRQAASCASTPNHEVAVAAVHAVLAMARARERDGKS